MEHYQTIVGISLMSIAQNTYSGFFFVTLKEWKERKRPEEQYQAIMAHLNSELGKLPEAVAFAFPPPAIQGIGLAGGATLVLEDRAGKPISFLAENVNKFLGRPQKTGIGQGDDHPSSVRAPALCQGGPRQGAQTGG